MSHRFLSKQELLSSSPIPGPVHLYLKNIILWSLFPCESIVLWLDYTLVSTEVHSVCWPWEWKACISVCLLPWVTVCWRGHTVYVGEAMEHIIISPSLLHRSLLWILLRCCLIKHCYQVSWQDWAQQGAWCVAPHPAAAMLCGDAPLSSTGFVWCCGVGNPAPNPSQSSDAIYRVDVNHRLLCPLQQRNLRQNNADKYSWINTLSVCPLVIMVN